MRDRSEALDAVRGIAIALVVGYHYWPALVPGGSVGVDLFFVLSGFLIGGILLDNKGAEDYFATFYWRRFFRILPLYWLFLSVMPASPVMPVWWFLPFAQNFGWIAHGVFPIREPHTVTWSLAFEEQFYLLLPTMVASLSTRWLIRVLWACVIAAPLWRYGWAQSHPFAARLLLPCRLDSLMGGALVACFMRGHARSALIWTTLACAAPCLDLALHSLTGNGELMYSVIAFLFAGGLLVVVQSRPAPLRSPAARVARDRRLFDLPVPHPGAAADRLSGLGAAVDPGSRLGVLALHRGPFDPLRPCALALRSGVAGRSRGITCANTATPKKNMAALVRHYPEDLKGTDQGIAKNSPEYAAEISCLWRMGWDSNPRYACTHGGFQDRCLQPLGHPSGERTN